MPDIQPLVEPPFTNIEQAVLRALKDLAEGGSYQQIYEHIIKEPYPYYDKFKGKTPATSVSNCLSALIKNKDARIGRESLSGGGKNYLYYLRANEDAFLDSLERRRTESKTNSTQDDYDVEDSDDVDESNQEDVAIQTTGVITSKLEDTTKPKSFHERALHRLLCTYLSAGNLRSNIYTLTIKHERSTQEDKNQIWTHPDIVGVKFFSSKQSASRSLQKTLSNSELLEIYAFEVKKFINNDTMLKEGFFQAVSNSSWANYGYLAAFDFNSNLDEEMRRLNQAFGIGFIKISADAFQSSILYSSKRRSLDFRMIDKLSDNNEVFRGFIKKINDSLTAGNDHQSLHDAELIKFCRDNENDQPLTDSQQVEAWCKANHIPLDGEME